MFWAKIRKISHFFHLKITFYTAVKYCRILHGHVCVMCSRYACIKKHSYCSFSSITLCTMPHLSEHERSGTIGIIQTSVCISDITKYYNSHPSTLHRLWARNQVIQTVKKSTPVWSTRNDDKTSRHYIDNILRPVALPFLRQNYRRGNLNTNMTMSQLIFPASLSMFGQQI